MSENGNARKVNLAENRLFTMHDSSDPSQWRYVDSKRNPVDVAFRGQTSLHCDKTEMWFSGPDFLWKQNGYWPVMPGNMPSVANDDREIKRNANTVVAEEAKCFLHYLVTCFSSWTKLLNVIAWWLRFKTFCKAKLLHKAGHQPEFPGKDFISCEEINQASTEVVKLVEKEAFEDN